MRGRGDCEKGQIGGLSEREGGWRWGKGLEGKKEEGGEDKRGKKRGE